MFIALKLLNKMNNKTLIIYAGNKCNNNCMVCSVSKKIKRERGMREIINDMEIGREKDFLKIEFTGGEPSIRRDIFELVKKSKELGYEITGISTNGRMFKYEDFCEKIIKAGLNRITISLLGSKKEIHDAITRTPGSFGDILDALNNLKKHNIYINFSTVVNKINLFDLAELSKLILSKGVGHWNLLDLLEEGNAEKYLSALFYDYDVFLNEVGKIDISKFKEICFFDFPEDLFGNKFKNKKNIKIINKNDRSKAAVQIGLKK